jgi:putative glycosyltransferase (TIGR04348 family)
MEANSDMRRLKIVIVSPALADANNGNWRTAHRWQQLLSPTYRVKIVSSTVDATCNERHQALFTGDTGEFVPDLVIALHARKSHQAIVEIKSRWPQRPLVTVLTGTDLYKDLNDSLEAAESIALADAIIVLQEDAIQYVPQVHRRKTHVVFQSAKRLVPAVKSVDKLNCVVVGHLREEKSPRTVFDTVQRLTANDAIHITHIGAALDVASEAFAKQASQLTQTNKHYHWVGALPHGLTRVAIKRSHLLIHPSTLEGGANVIVEAITAGTPVIASRVSGNIGMLGIDYAGYFPLGDANALVDILRRCAASRNALIRLAIACKGRAPLFTPGEETRRLRAIIDSLLNKSP